MVVGIALARCNNYTLMVAKVIERLLLHLLLRSIRHRIATSYRIILRLFHSGTHCDAQFLLILALLSGVVRCLVLLHWILYLG